MRELHKEVATLEDCQQFMDLVGFFCEHVDTAPPETKRYFEMLQSKFMALQETRAATFERQLRGKEAELCRVKHLDLAYAELKLSEEIGNRDWAMGSWVEEQKRCGELTQELDVVKEELEDTKREFRLFRLKLENLLEDSK